MIIILSEDITNKYKELIVNAIYELTPKLPIFINYMKPIFNISGQHEKEIYIKVPGDDIYKADLDKERKILKSLKDVVKDNFLFYAWKEKSKSHRGPQDEFNLDIIDNFDIEDSELLMGGYKNERILFLHSKEDTMPPKGMESIKIESFEYEDVKSFFEKTFTSTGEKLSFIELAELSAKAESTEKESVMVVKFEEVEAVAESAQNSADADISTEEALLEETLTETDAIIATGEGIGGGIREQIYNGITIEDVQDAISNMTRRRNLNSNSEVGDGLSIF